MKREIATTHDGTKTLFVPELDEHYHSIHGAYNEAMHVFIDAGLNLFYPDKVSILEIGFGTGLNAILSFRESKNYAHHINYTGIEAYPVQPEELELINYTSLFNNPDINAAFSKMHNTPWETKQEISPYFELTKRQQNFNEIDDINTFDLIYYDAFAPSAQPELWTLEMFNIMFKALKPNGILVTYCAQGQVKRNMKAAGFIVERLAGPPGKREMTRATKPQF